MQFNQLHPSFFLQQEKDSGKWISQCRSILQTTGFQPFKNWHIVGILVNRKRLVRIDG
ncbi:MAG: hypothetical protein IPP72_04685 [Chitinophagaceae bacterium]|nr:hypothetical protein [Chitinophagaceae bacterium]